MATWVDLAGFREVVVDGNGKITSYFSYRGNDSDGFVCALFVPTGTFLGYYASKAEARAAGDAILD
jgi:hypothetical protein